jgi:energy-coupling factor transport system ATP-binding protein
MIDLEQVSYWYPESATTALEAVNLRVGEGQRFLIAGPSGAGKSTLLRVLNGLVPHFYGGRFRGRARIAGLDTRSAGPVRLAEHVGMVFQEPQSRFLTAAVDDELAFGMECSGAQQADLQRRVREIVERLNLGALLGRPLDRLSAGEQAKVAIGAALSRQPGLIVMDEPCTELDPPAAQAVVDWVEDLQREHAFTLAVSDHHLRRWLDHVDQVVYLRAPGRLEAAGAPSNAAERMEFEDSTAAAHDGWIAARRARSELRLRRTAGTGGGRPGNRRRRDRRSGRAQWFGQVNVAALPHWLEFSREG